LQALISPILLYAACVLGAVGVALALPRRGNSPQLIGALIGALALGVVFIALAVPTGRNAGLGGYPNFNFYLFSAIALGAALRVISHPRPVYAALYFILTIIASAGLYVLLSAEFMAFALIIVYAGAILITYLFVLMLATESPTADQVEALADYDRYSREPLMAAIVGFLLVAMTTTMLAKGVSAMPQPQGYAAGHRLEQLPRKVETSLREAGLMQRDETIARDADENYLIDLYDAKGTELWPGSVTIAFGNGQTRVVRTDDPKWPKDLALTNVEGVGFTLLAEHPGAIEIAGVVLLMAMLGAVVLARKKVELDDRAKFEAQKRSLADEFSPEKSHLVAPSVPGAPNVREAEIKPVGSSIRTSANGAGVGGMSVGTGSGGGR
jgi:NADH-quinone oxidoreductase subunit J